MDVAFAAIFVGAIIVLVVTVVKGPTTSVRNYSQLLGSWMQVFAILTGGTWAVFQWEFQKEENRVDKNITFIQLYLSQELIDTRKRLKTTWVNNIGKLARDISEYQVKYKIETQNSTGKQLKPAKTQHNYSKY